MFSPHLFHLGWSTLTRNHSPGHLQKSSLTVSLKVENRRRTPVLLPYHTVKVYYHWTTNSIILSASISIIQCYCFQHNWNVPFGTYFFSQLCYLNWRMENTDMFTTWNLWPSISVPKLSRRPSNGPCYCICKIPMTETN